MEQTFLSAAERAPFAQIFARVQRTHPLVDCITNIVTVNDVANGLLAIDARPVMASAPEEITFFMERADALLLNLGATGAEQRTAMLAGAEAANALAKPVVVDPVASHIAAAPRHAGGAIGDAPDQLHSRQHQRDQSAGRSFDRRRRRGRVGSRSRRSCSVRAGCAHGAGAGSRSQHRDRDQRAAGHHLRWPHNLRRQRRNAMMTRVTGSGCTLTGIVAAFAAAAPEDILRAATARSG